MQYKSPSVFFHHRKPRYFPIELPNLDLTENVTKKCFWLKYLIRTFIHSFILVCSYKTTQEQDKVFAFFDAMEYLSFTRLHFDSILLASFEQTRIRIQQSPTEFGGAE